MQNEYPPLGLGELPMPVRLYVGQESDGTKQCGWYTVDHSTDAKRAISDPALHGFLRKIELVEKKSQRRGDAMKLDLHVQADKPYIVRSGLDTIFTRGAILALDAIDTFERPITIAVIPGTEGEGKAVFARVYQDGQPIRVEWDAKIDLQPMIVRLARRLGVNQSDLQTHENGATEPAPPIAPPPEPTPRVQTPVNPSARQTEARMSNAAQHTELERLGRSQGWDRPMLDQHSLNDNGWAIADLTFQEAIKYTHTLARI